MAQDELTPETLIVHITGMDRLWALKSHLDIPLAHVVAATKATDEAIEWLSETHISGTHVPGMLSAGTFHHEGDRVFWDVHDPQKAIAIELIHDKLARLVIEVDEPEYTVSEIGLALKARATPE